MIKDTNVCTSLADPLSPQWASLRSVQKLILVRCLQDETGCLDFSVVIANAEENAFFHLQEAGLCVQKKKKNPAIRIPVADSLGSCDSQASKQGLSVQAADG